MSHWFDRLASWSAEDSGEDRGLRLTRRQAVRTAATGAAGVSAASLLGSPLIANALADNAGNCACQNAQKRENHQAMHKLRDNFLDYYQVYILLPVASLGFMASLIALNVRNTTRMIECGSCENQVPLKPPPPSAQPCTQRGGLRLRGDQCEGPPGGAETGSGGCAGGTSSCPVPGGGDLCCFAGDLCCGGGCCCIAEVGCGCCGA